MTARLELAPGVMLWRSRLTRPEQHDLLRQIEARVRRAPFYRATMPRTGAPLSVEMTNFGPLGWVSDQHFGYRYQEAHPLTGEPWPDIPPELFSLWQDLAPAMPPPEACLVNCYRGQARMGLHQDKDEGAMDVPVLSVSLGDDAIFRFGGASRKDATRTVKLASGDVLLFGGPARLMFHGIDRVLAGSSTLIAGGGRLNLTLRRVHAASAMAQKEGTRPGG